MDSVVHVLRKCRPQMLRYSENTAATQRTELRIVHPESFRSNAQNAIAFARRNRPRVNCSGEFACVCVRLRVLFAI